MDINKLRVQAAIKLDELIKELNSSILRNPDGTLKKKSIHSTNDGESIFKKGDMLLDTEKIQETVKALRSSVLAIASMYSVRADQQFYDMSDEVKKNGSIAEFNNVSK